MLQIGMRVFAQQGRPPSAWLEPRWLSFLHSIMAASMQTRPEGLSLGSNNITRTARITRMHVEHTDRPRGGDVSYHIMNTE